MFTERATPELLAVACPHCKAQPGVHCAVGRDNGGMAGKGKLYPLQVWDHEKQHERNRWMPAVHAKRAKKARGK